MQLKRLYIKEYKLFKDFTYDFSADNQHFVHVLIGINGSGKSTILEAIAEIFSCVVLGEKAKFGFELEYSIMKSSLTTEVYGFQLGNLQTFDIKLNSERGEFPSAKMDNQSFSLKGIGTKNNFALPKPGIFLKLHDILPDSIIIYYSGLSEIMQLLCVPHNQKLSKNLRSESINAPSIFYYHEPAFVSAILLSLLSFEYGDIPEFLKEKAKIIGFNEIRIYLKEPSWADSSSIMSDFWGATGEVRVLLDFLCQNYTGEEGKYDFLDNDLILSNVNTKELEDDRLQISIVGQKTLFVIKEFLGEEKALFRILRTLYNDDLLEDIQIELIKDENGQNIPFSILSEGEQQAITIKGLTELLGGENTLFLFDEPDTFLHPQWQRNFISEIEQNVELNHQNELCYLIATHSPQILSNAHPDITSVRIIEDGKLVQQTPKHYGREISSILYNLMGVDERNEVIKKRLSQLFMLIEDEEIEEAGSLLSELTELLGDTDADIQNATLQLNYLKDEKD